MSVWLAARDLTSPCYMRETFVQLDRNRISIRLPKTEGGTPIRVRPALPAQRRVTHNRSKLSKLSICVPSSA
jgi:hypothetical protein